MRICTVLGRRLEAHQNFLNLQEVSIIPYSVLIPPATRARAEHVNLK